MKVRAARETILRRKPIGKLLLKEVNVAQVLWGPLSDVALEGLQQLLTQYNLSVASGELVYLQTGWYVTHAGLLRLAQCSQCAGIDVIPVAEFSEPAASRWAFRATVYKTSRCRGFVGYGDASPSNVSPIVRGAEMRVAETRAVNRALRKAYGVGICSVEELGASVDPVQSIRQQKKRPASSQGKGGDQPRLRDRLCQLIGHHQLDPVLVKAYALDFCGTKTLNEATREQIEKFIDLLADWAAKDKNALVEQLNKYLRNEQGAA